MRKNLTRVLVGALAVSMVGVFAGCGSSDSSSENSSAAESSISSSESTNIANPVVECTAEELAEKIGIDLDAPEDAENVSYSFIEDDENPVAQVQFEYDGENYCYRAQMTDMTSLTGYDNSDEKVDDEMKAERAVENTTEFVGLYYSWETMTMTTVSEKEAVCAVVEGENGYISWLDAVPGVLYSLSMDNSASEENLQTMAEEVFVETQDES